MPFFFFKIFWDKLVNFEYSFGKWSFSWIFCILVVYLYIVNGFWIEFWFSKNSRLDWKPFIQQWKSIKEKELLYENVSTNFFSCLLIYLRGFHQKHFSWSTNSNRIKIAVGIKLMDHFWSSPCLFQHKTFVWNFSQIILITSSNV